MAEYRLWCAYGIRALDEVKKDIIDLAALFPEGIKMSFVERILKYNKGCSMTQFKQSISSLCKMKYVLIGDNDTLRLQHDKLKISSRKNLEFIEEEERFVELMHSCKHFFSEAVYETSDNSDFIFCANGLIELEKEINLVKHLGILEKYISILYGSFRYFEIYHLYEELSRATMYGSKIATMLPLRSIIQILDSHQKISVFEKGLEMSNILSDYYNMDLYRAKFLLQSYNYDDAINVIKNNLNTYESWSIYLNGLQHLRQDEDARDFVLRLVGNFPEYQDEEYYYIILRNSCHLFEFCIAKENILKALEYFESLGNKFVESTCYNNLGILYLYQSLVKENIQIARQNFKQAQKIMSLLKSNEEYQSIINIGISYFGEQDYNMALEYFENAIQILPSSLTFDNIKLRCNIAICNYILEYLEKKHFRTELLNLYSEAEELPDPWISLLCKYNLAILHPDSNNRIRQLQNEYPGEIHSYGLIIDTTYGAFMLGISPHWRY